MRKKGFLFGMFIYLLISSVFVAFSIYKTSIKVLMASRNRLDQHRVLLQEKYFFIQFFFLVCDRFVLK